MKSFGDEVSTLAAVTHEYIVDSAGPASAFQPAR
jgi:hypothetical protein